VLVLLPADTEVDDLGPMPSDVRLLAVPEGPLPDEASDARMLVLAGGLGRRLEEILEAAPRLEVIQTVSAGIDFLVGRLPDHLTVCNASGVHDPAVSEWCLGVIIAMRRRFPEFVELQQRGEWDGDLNPATAYGTSPLAPLFDLEGARVLILGYGSIGRALASHLEPFGAVVTGVARRTREGVHGMDEARTLAATSDVVVVLLPDTPETAGVIDGAFLDAMPRGALLVNAGRGRQVVTADLVARLHDGHVRAALDVTDPEPLPADDPLWRAPGLLITPHVAGATAQLARRSMAFVGDQIRRMAAGEDLRNVRTEGY
jgi:phosphoglycerate dehydrogenase-like enzyme